MPQPSDPNAANQVSGPGALSQRTDAGPAQAMQTLPDAKYGENAAFQQQQQGAPMSASPGPAQQPEELPANPAAGAVVPMSAETQRPGEPVTHGAELGPGAGTEALGIHPAQAEQQDMTQRAVNLPLLQFVANQPQSSPSSRLFVNLLKANS